MTADLETSARARPAAKEVVRYVIGMAIGVIVLVVLVGKRGELAAALHQFRHASYPWVLAAIGAEGLSLLGYAWLQRRVLGLSGGRVTMADLFLLTMANDAIANTVPGEPAVSSAYRYRYYRRRGVSGASAGWTVFTILIAQAMGMSVLLLLGVLIALASATTASAAGAAVLGFVIVVAAAAVLVRRDLVLRMIAALVRGVRRVTGHPKGAAGERIESTLARMREIPLSTRSTVGIVAVAAAVWFGDFGCLLCGFGAVRAPVPWGGVLLAYGAAQVDGSLPVVPGGLGVVEGSLAVILMAYGADRVAAVSAALAFRLVSFWLAIALGWGCVGLIARQLRRSGPAGRTGPDIPESGLEQTAEV